MTTLLEPRRLYSNGNTWRTWPCDKLVRIRKEADFFPTLTRLSQSGYELELWVGGEWKNGRNGNVAHFPCRWLYAADDWKVDIDERVVDTEIFAHLTWRTQCAKWIAKNPIDTTDPWRMMTRSRVFLMCFSPSAGVVRQPKAHPCQSALDPRERLRIGPLAWGDATSGVSLGRSMRPRNSQPVVKRLPRDPK